MVEFPFKAESQALKLLSSISDGFYRLNIAPVSQNFIREPGTTVTTVNPPVTNTLTKDPYRLGEQEFRDLNPMQNAAPSLPLPVREANEVEDSEDALQLSRQNLERFRHSTRDYAIWNLDRYKTATARSFDHVVCDNDEYKAALFDAARQRKPVVLMFGKSEDPATRQIVENSLKDARDRSGGQGVFVFVDLEATDPNSSIGRYAAGLTEKHGFPMMVCFTLRPGDEYNPARSDAPLYHQTGPVSSFRLIEAINRGVVLMNGLQFPDLPPIKAIMPVVQIESCAQERAQEEPSKQAPDWRASLPESARLIEKARAVGVDRKSAYEILRQAIKVADHEEAVMKAATRAELGFACLEWGFPEQGIAWLLDAGKKHPDIYLNIKFSDRVKQSKLSSAAAEELLYEGMRNPTWYEANKQQALARLLKPHTVELSKPASVELPQVDTVSNFPSPFAS